VLFKKAAVTFAERTLKKGDLVIAEGRIENRSYQKEGQTHYMTEIAVREGRQTRPDLKVGICGEHGGDPASIAFCHATGLTYVSCSPFRVPVARLAAAQAALASVERDR